MIRLVLVLSSICMCAAKSELQQSILDNSSKCDIIDKKFTGEALAFLTP